MSTWVRVTSDPLSGTDGNASRLLPVPGPWSLVPGFTLLELLVVLAVLSLTAALVFPLLPSTEAGALKSSARGVAAMLRYLEEEAVTTKTAYRLHLEPGSGLSVMKRLPDGDEALPADTFLTRPLLSSGVTIVDVVTGRLGKVTEGEVRIDVGPGGLGDLLSIHLQGKGGENYTVTAYPASGKVTVASGYQEAGI